MGGKALPYDAEIEYIETTGGVAINSGYIPSGNNINILSKWYFGGYTSTASWLYWYGSYTSGTAQTFRIARRDDLNNQVCITNGASASGSATDAVTVAIGSTYEIDVDSSRLIINGTMIKGKRRQVSSTANTGFLYVIQGGFKGKFYYMELLKDGRIMLNIIPVRIGTDAYLFDKVSKTFLENVGTGTPIPAPDKI
jgi:archaellum component FlaF (FlaF/FlaG flagellin family)